MILDRLTPDNVFAIGSPSDRQQEKYEAINRFVLKELAKYLRWNPRTLCWEIDCRDASIERGPEGKTLNEWLERLTRRP